MLLKTIKKLINKIGLNLSKFNLDNNRDYRLNFFLKHQSIDCVLDVGANSGQYGTLLRDIGYKNKIISFEPIPEAYKKLNELIKKDNLWEAFNFGLGNKTDELEINISKNLLSNSILKMNEDYFKVGSEIMTSHDIESTKYISKEKIKIKTLTEFMLTNKLDYKNIFLKMDVQGYEDKILEGIENFDNIEGMQVEMSLINLYENQMIFEDLYKKIKTQGYELWDFRRGFSNVKNGRIFQMDGIFFKLK